MRPYHIASHCITWHDMPSYNWPYYPTSRHWQPTAILHLTPTTNHIKTGHITTTANHHKLASHWLIALSTFYKRIPSLTWIFVLLKLKTFFSHFDFIWFLFIRCNFINLIFSEKIQFLIGYHRIYDLISPAFGYKQTMSVWCYLPFLLSCVPIFFRAKCRWAWV